MSNLAKEDIIISYLNQMCVVCNCAYILLDYEKADLKHFEKGTLYHRRLLDSTVEQGSESTQKKQAPWTMDAMLVLLAYHEWRLKLSLLRASWCSPAVLSSPQGLMNRPFLSLSLPLSLRARVCVKIFQIMLCNLSLFVGSCLVLCVAALLSADRWRKQVWKKA